MDEVVVVNEKDEVIGTMLKSEAHKKGTPHRIAITYLEKKAGEILVQVRADGYLDHSSAGHVDPGESYEQAALRELAEELGVTGVPLKYVGHGNTKAETYSDGARSHVFDIFSCIAEAKELQVDEVESVYWAKPEDVLQDMQGGNQEKYCGAFKVSLPIFLSARNK